MRPARQSLLDTTPSWLSLSLALLSTALLVSGVGISLGLATTVVISPFTLLLHLVWAISGSAVVLNLRTGLRPEKKPLLAVAVAVAIGSVWSSVQQWLAYAETGYVNDLVIVAASMMMDVAGGVVSYVLFHFNRLKKTI